MLDDDPYVARRGPFFEAALPSENPGVEFTFDMLLDNFRNDTDSILRDRMSSEGLMTLAKAAGNEGAASAQDREEFTRQMDFLFGEIPADDHDAASRLISEAYRVLHKSRRDRYTLVLDALSVADRAVVNAQYFDKLEASVGPVPHHPSHYQFVLAINLSQGNMNRMTRTWTYSLARGMPVKKAEISWSNGCIVQGVTGGPSNGY